MTSNSGMSKVSFGIGGFKGGPERRFLAEVESDTYVIKTLAASLRDVGFWTVVSDSDSPKTTITIGEVIKQ